MSEEVKKEDELFELCKTVYEKTDWTTESTWCAYEGDEPEIWNSCEISEFQTEKFVIELPCVYTSDYILEKLEPLSPAVERNTINGHQKSEYGLKNNRYWQLLETQNGARLNTPHMVRLRRKVLRMQQERLCN